MYYVRTLRHPFRVLAGRQGQGLVHTAVEGHDISPLSLRCTDEQSAAGGPYTQLTGLDLLVSIFPTIRKGVKTIPYSVSGSSPSNGMEEASADMSIASTKRPVAFS